MGQNLNSINDVFAALANTVNDDLSPGELITATAVLALARIVVTDLRRIADAQEAMSRQYVADMAAARTGQK